MLSWTLFSNPLRTNRENVYSFPRDDEVELFKGLNKTIAKFEFEKRLAPGVPGKVVVYFNSQGINSDNTRLMDELGIFKGNHRDVPIIAFGDKEELEVIVWNREKDIFDLPVNEFHPSVIEPMWERLCSVPATLQYDKCWELTNSRETLNKYIGYVTPNHIQYWAMYPEYFIKSRSIRFTFKSSRGATDQVKVCFSRGTRTPETEEQNCKETSKNDKEISFWMSNPCEGYSVWNCPPFYFSIQGIRNEEQTTQFSISCAGVKCFVPRTPDQIEFTVEHDGVRCNGASKLVSPLIAISILLAIALSRSK